METIVAIIISIVLVSILFFSLRSTVKRIDINTKKYFIDKLQDYDYLIEEKKKVLNELEKRIEKNKEIISKETNVEKIVCSSENDEYYGELNIPKYMEENLFEKYKAIKEKFSFDEEGLVIDFINNIEGNDSRDYFLLSKIRKMFDNKKIYEILKLRIKDQKKYISDMLSENEFIILEKYIKLDNVKINTLITKLDMVLEKNAPVLYVYTGEKNKNFDYISPIIKTEYDETINEGIKINYKGIIYDFSL